jgi:hypothetical protein
MAFSRVGLTVLLAICVAAPCAAEPPSPILMGEDSYVVALDVTGEPPIAYEAGPDFIGAQFHAGGRGGTLRPVVVTAYNEYSACKMALDVTPPVPLQKYAAYSRPATFIPLERFPTARQAVIQAVEPAIRAQGGTDAINPFEIWRFKPRADQVVLIFAAIHSANYLDPGTSGNPGGFDAIALFREEKGDVVLLDQVVWLDAVEDGTRMDPTAIATAINPFDGAIDLFVEVTSFEYVGYSVYDVTGGKLRERATGECSM